MRYLAMAAVLACLVPLFLFMAYAMLVLWLVRVVGTFLFIKKEKL